MANKKRLIDADALKKAMCYKCNDEYSDEPCEPSDCVFCNAINDAPTVDAVEVVRCKDCKWYMPGELFTDIMFCHRLKKENGRPAKYNFCKDDFCSYGERMNDA